MNRVGGNVMFPKAEDEMSERVWKIGRGMERAWRMQSRYNVLRNLLLCWLARKILD